MEIEQTALSRKKKLFFGIITFLLVILTVEVFCRVVVTRNKEASVRVQENTPGYIQERFKYAERMTDAELGDLADGGFRTINDIEEKELEHFKLIISDFRRLLLHTKPSASGEYEVYDPDYIYKTIKINRSGFRGSTWSVPKGEKEQRVFIVGESTAFSFLVDEEHSIHVMLERYLNEKMNRTKMVKVFCAALPGINSNIERKIVREVVIQAEADIVVVINGFNDSMQSRSRKDSVDRFLEYLIHLSEKSWVKHLASTRVISMSVSEYAKRYQSYRNVMPAADIADQYVNNMKEMKTLLETSSTRLLVYLQPSTLEPSGSKKLNDAERVVWWHWMRPGARLKWLRAGAGLYAMAGTHVKAYPLMLKRLTENDFEVFDGHSAKRIDLDHKRTFFRDGAHLTNYGNSFVVREIGDLLLKKGWI